MYSRSHLCITLSITAVAYKLNEIMKERIIEIVELGQPKSLIQRENTPITELIKTDVLIKELNEQLRLYNIVGQSEQFYCNCSRAKGLDHDEDGMPYCIECQKPVQ